MAEWLRSAFGRNVESAAISMNDFERRWADTGAAVLEAVQVVGKSGWYILGPEVASFEETLARKAGRRFAIGCASGLDAIEIALRAVGLRPGMKVLTTPLSAFATTLAILRAQGVPVFVDVDDSGLLDLEQAEKALDEDGSIRFMVPVHLFGHVCDLQDLADLKERFALRVVEDCAQAIGGRSAGHAVGSVGDAAAISFYPTKNLGALGDGGAILTDDPVIRDACRCLRNYGETAKYVHEHLGLNSRLDELHAAILQRALLPKLPEWTARRERIAACYLAGLRHPAVRAVHVPLRSHSVWHLFPILVDPAQREDLRNHLEASGIKTAIHYPIPIPRQRSLVEQSPFEVEGELARTESFARSEISLPIHPYLRDGEVDAVISAINRWKPQ